MDKNCQNIPTLMIKKSGGSISQEVIQLCSRRLCLSKITNIGLKTTKCYLQMADLNQVQLTYLRPAVSLNLSTNQLLIKLLT